MPHEYATPGASPGQALTPLWHLDCDPITKLVGLAYAEQADLDGWIAQPDLALVVAMTGLSLHAVQALTRQLLARGVLVAGRLTPGDPATWGYRVVSERR